MTEQDYEPFLSEFRRMASAFERYPQSLEQMRGRGDVYFNVLKKFPLTVVIAKADAWIDRETKMPKPAEWAGMYARASTERIIPTMEDPEAREWLRAERQKWEDGLCGCDECREAGVADKPIRFVPMFDRDDAELKMLCFGRVVCRGEWIHGLPLMRWHIARENFFTMFSRHTKAMSMNPAEDSRRERQHIARAMLAKHHTDETDRTARILGEQP